MRDKTWFTERIGKTILRIPVEREKEARQFSISDEKTVDYLVGLGDTFKYEDIGVKVDPLESMAPIISRRISTPDNANVCISCEG